MLLSERILKNWTIPIIGCKISKFKFKFDERSKKKKKKFSYKYSSENVIMKEGIAPVKWLEFRYLLIW